MNNHKRNPDYYWSKDDIPVLIKGSLITLTLIAFLFFGFVTKGTLQIVFLVMSGVFVIFTSLYWYYVLDSIKKALAGRKNEK